MKPIERRPKIVLFGFEPMDDVALKIDVDEEAHRLGLEHGDRHARSPLLGRSEEIRRVTPR